MPTRPRAARWAGAAAVSAAALVLTGCAAASAGGAPGSEGPPCPVAAVDVVASIEQWGDVAAALGGACAQVTTIVTGSVGDPHDYEPTPGDAAAFSRAQLLVLNGLHYDDWAEKVVETLDAMPAEVVGGAVVGLEPAAGSDAAPAGRTRTSGTARRTSGRWPPRSRPRSRRRHLTPQRTSRLGPRSGRPR